MDYDWKHESDPVTIILKGRKEGVSMRIKDIRIRNFKSIREIHIPDIEQALILVGQNSTERRPFWMRSGPREESIRFSRKISGKIFPILKSC